MTNPDEILLTKELLSFNTINPPGNEMEVAQFVGKLLLENGFEVSYHEYEENRLHLVAEKGVSGEAAPLVFSGHFDTVALGKKPWSEDPFSGVIKGDRIYGRGSSDMKGGLAAMTVAAIEATRTTTPMGGIRMIFTSGEELGCQGINQLVKSSAELGKARAVIVGEPTANHPAIAHKGALYLNASTKGKTAHSSMPELGDNAVYKAARAVVRIEKLQFHAENDLLLGLPTINVGKFRGGMNINSVPDHAEFTIDIRSTTMTSHQSLLERLKRELGDEVVLETLVDHKPVSNSESGPFIQMVYEVCGIDGKSSSGPKSLPYLTDGSVLQAFYGGVPTIILGPGEPALAHQTDEYCSIKKIKQSVAIYKSIINGKSEK
jgi:succinyl-diaminopimelate desuccinylase